MPQRARFWLPALALIVVSGLLSRATHTGLVVIDKYLGDALYASMVYAILRLLMPGSPTRTAILAAIVMCAIETFQLTHIPAQMYQSNTRLIRVAGRMLGTEFQWLDLVAYWVGIVLIFALDVSVRANTLKSQA